MKRTLHLISALALMVAAAGAAHAQGVRILGRSEPNPGGGFVIHWPNSGFETRLNGSHLTATIEDYGDNWLNVEVDGVVTRLDLKPGSNTYTLFNGAPGLHTIRVTRRTGAPSGVTRFLDILPDGGRIDPTPAPERRVLVIGDSITSGYGVEGADQTCRYSHDTQNADLAYPAIAAKAFGADLHSVSIDGRGLIRNYAGDDPTMDTVAWRMLPDYPARWPTSAYRPQVVVVNLGTFDFSAGDPGDRFDAAYTRLLRQLRAAYPEARIYAAFGPMLNGDAYTAARNSVFGAVEEMRSRNDLRVSFIEFSPTTGGRRYGCDWHPGLDAQRAMASKLGAAIQKDLGWTSEAQGNPVLIWSGSAPPAPSAAISSAPKVPIKTSLH